MINEKHSYKDYMHQTFVDDNPSDWTGDVIGSCFYQEADIDGTGDPLVDVFPLGASCRFINCNLDNCRIPPSCSLGDGNTNKRIRVQNDLEDWVVDQHGAPVEPQIKFVFEALGLSVNPGDIPGARMSESVTKKKKRELKEG